MSFGRLDVYWPNGPIEIYQLEKPTVAIGRQRGNDIVIDTEAISRYHTTLTFQDGQCYIKDLGSVNGTYVDGICLEADEVRLLHGGEELQIGDMRAIYHPASDTLATTGLAEETKIHEATQPTFRVALEGADQTVSPGMHVRSQLLVENRGEQTDRYFIEVDGLPQEWVRLDRAELTLEPGANSRVIVSIKPPRRPESVAGDYQVVLHVRSGSLPAQPVDAQIRLHVQSYNAFGIRIESGPFELDTAFSLFLHNQGNTPMEVSLHGQDPAGALQFTFQPQQVAIQAGQRVSALVRAEAPRFGQLQSEMHPFSVVVTSHDAAGWQAALPGQMQVPAGAMLARRWMPWIVAGGSVVLLGGLLLLAALLLRPAAPEFVSPPALADSEVQTFYPGDAVTLRWEVSEADRLDLQIDHDGETPHLISLNSTDREYTHTLETPGAYAFTLVAQAGGIQVESVPVIVGVAPLPVVTYFRVAPESLLRGVQTTLAIEWQVENTTSVYIEGLRPLLCAPSDATFGPAGSDSFEVCPPDALEEVSLSLIPQPDGQHDTRLLPIVRAECRVSQEGVVLRLMDPLADPLSLEGGAVVFLEGEDATGTWILVTTEAGVTGWLPRDEALDCGGIDLSRLVPLESTFPTPAPSQTPIPTLSPTPTPITPTPIPTLTPTP